MTIVAAMIVAGRFEGEPGNRGNRVARFHGRLDRAAHEEQIFLALPLRIHGGAKEARKNCSPVTVERALNRPAVGAVFLPPPWRFSGLQTRPESNAARSSDPERKRCGLAHTNCE